MGVHAVLDRVAALPRGLRVITVIATVGAALAALCGVVMWMLLRPRRLRA